ncbi:uncharacterized protein EV154DRAFT_564633 [Mucor mucedo]|uniref:uncharacterized protein n=1 Tax=Mucor mucedo TaxID=29922 RepID=UPI00222104A9|nr:uncharacterized protein EV154DRAFT_564633 [Mucor mucedo]KAI7890156.1 hypothetical protein EV154DRAFT_564633 [Mucor mucedo]
MSEYIIDTWRNNLTSAYNRLRESLTDEMGKHLFRFTYQQIQSVDLVKTVYKFKKNITNTSDTEDTTIASQVLFLEEIFVASYLYKIYVPLNHNEAIFNNYFVEPNLKAVCNSIDHSKYNWAKLGFYDGEEEFLFMTKQLKRKGTFELFTNYSNGFSQAAIGTMIGMQRPNVQNAVGRVAETGSPLKMATMAFRLFLESNWDHTGLLVLARISIPDSVYHETSQVDCIYKTDGVVRLQEAHDIEICVVEVSNE